MSFYDAHNHLQDGRFAGRQDEIISAAHAAGVAKMLLNGEEVAVLNAEGTVMSGDLAYLIEKYKHRRTMKDKSTPEHSPKWPRRPDLFVRRIIRGMLPFDNARGRQALKRLRVHIGAPDDLQQAEKVVVPGANAEKLNTKYHTIELLCERLGYSRGG